MKSVAEFLVILVMLYHTVNTTKQIFYHDVLKNNFSPLPQFPTLYLERKQCFLTEHIQILGEKYYQQITHLNLALLFLWVCYYQTREGKNLTGLVVITLKCGVVLLSVD